MRFSENRRLFTTLLLGGLFVLLLAQVPTSHADTGPKPSADFKFEYEIPVVPIVSGTLWLCDDKQCAEKHALEEGGPQRFTCDADSCWSRAYGYGKYLKLEITFADGVRESEVFEKHNFRTEFTVTVTDSGLRVQEKRKTFDGLFGLALIFTVLCETMVATIYQRERSLPRALLYWVPVASLLTLPVVWFGFTRFPWADYSVLCGGELFVVVFEAIFLYLALRRSVSLRKLALLSLIMNFTSFLLPLLYSLLDYVIEG
jgi:hypothetical protein